MQVFPDKDFELIFAEKEAFNSGVMVQKIKNEQILNNPGWAKHCAML
jgi:hypothetical protein